VRLLVVDRIHCLAARPSGQATSGCQQMRPLPNVVQCGDSFPGHSAAAIQTHVFAQTLQVHQAPLQCGDHGLRAVAHVEDHENWADVAHPQIAA
jgi:hypothetical protein